MGMAGIPRIPREIRVNEDCCCGNTADAGTPRGRRSNLAGDQNPDASV